MKVAIRGAAGLAAARCLRTAGHEVEVCEQAPALRTEGVALILWPGGTDSRRDVLISSWIEGRRGILGEGASSALGAQHDRAEG